MKKYSSVIGCGFGDEGKGVVTNTLSKNPGKTLVVRYSGGQQAGHTVYKNSEKFHVFSNVGSGTFNYADTYWSFWCTVDPIAVINEVTELHYKFNLLPKLLIDYDSPITTPYDVIDNQKEARRSKHGSVGVGVGTTIERQEDFYSLTFKDLFYPTVFRLKLDMIRKYYGVEQNSVLEEAFCTSCENLKGFAEPVNGYDLLNNPSNGYDHIIFESSQGLMLDQNIGFFPHVTRADVGIKRIQTLGFETEINLVSRGYQTRHGNGPMTTEDIPHKLGGNIYETNLSHEYQGQFRIGLLDVGLLRYAIDSAGIVEKENKSLTLTCMDIVKKDLRYLTPEGNIVECKEVEYFALRVANELNIEKVYFTDCPWKDRTLIRG